MAMISGIANTQTSIEWMISELTYPDYQYSFRLEVWTESGSLVTSENWSSNSGQPYTLRKITGLQPGSFYTAKAWTRYLTEAQVYIGSAVYATLGSSVPTPTVPDQPSGVSVTPSTSDEGRLYVSWGSSSRASDYLVTIYGSAGGYVDDVTTTSTNTAFSGLIGGKSYYVKVVPRNSYGNGPTATSDTVYMPVINVRPNNWKWATDKTAGASVNITATEWNNFLNRIDEFRVYKGHGGGTYTYAVSGRRIEASQYNQARLAISSMGTVPSSVTSGTRINAKQFNDIRDYLNAIT